MKLKDKIRDKLRHWLLEDDLFQVEAAKKSYNDAVRKCVYANIQLSDAAVTYKNSQKLVDDCHKMMNSMIDVGTDVGFCSDDHSWAVVCIKGRPEYVSFIQCVLESSQCKRLWYSSESRACLSDFY